MPQSEILALKDLYDSTNGAEWDYVDEIKYGSAWDFDTDGFDPC
jgi:hypothetical protein